jgi:uncharacterized protein (TIGR02172 family)
MFNAETMIGVGNTANVYELDDDKIIKLFHIGYSYNAIVHEYNNSQLISATNINAPKSYEIIKYKDQYGIVYDRIYGRTLEELVLESLDLNKCCGILAALHQRILDNKLSSASDIKNILEKHILSTQYISEKSKNELKTILQRLPNGDCYCHGDFHFGNVIVNNEKEYVIDFMNVAKGNKLFDIARSYYLIEMTPVPAGFENQDVILKLKQEAALIYLNNMNIKKSDIKDYLIVTAAARYSELNQAQEEERRTIDHFLKQYGL